MGFESYPTKVDTDKMYQKLPKKRAIMDGRMVHGHGRQETDKYLLSRFRSVKMVGFYNGKNTQKKELLNGACYHFFVIPKAACTAESRFQKVLFFFCMVTTLI